MIPILYQREETEFLSQGYGRLADIISCTVTEERNGIYECEFQYPITGVNYAEIQEGRIIACTHDNTGDIQPFVIYRKSAPINGIVTFNAHHVSYELNNVIVAPFTAENISMTLASLNLYSMTTNRFNFLTDKTVYQKEYVLDHPAPVRELLGGVEGSILDVYGTGEWEFNRFLCYLHLHRGTNSGVTIRYAKNLIDITHELDSSDVYDAIVPYWKDSETGEVVYGGVVVGSTTIKYTAPITTENRVVIRTENGDPLEIEYERITAVAFDFSDQFEEKPTADQLEQFAEEYLNNNEPWIPHENIRIDFVQLAETAEYSEYAPLQSVKLCDSVNVYYSALGVNAENIKVISTTWNVLAEKYDEIELGKPRTSFAQLILGEAYSEVEGLKTEYITATKLQQAIQNATDQITGATGGNIVFHYNAEGHPYEMLIMDTDSEATASHIWRYNYAGWGHSSDGGQTYSLAATLDGGFVADFITTGILNADLIRAGTIQGVSDDNYWNLQTGELSAGHGYIGSFHLSDGKMTLGTLDSLVEDGVAIGTDGISYSHYLSDASRTWTERVTIQDGCVKWFTNGSEIVNARSVDSFFGAYVNGYAYRFRSVERDMTFLAFRYHANDPIYTNRDCRLDIGNAEDFLEPNADDVKLDIYLESAYGGDIWIKTERAWSGSTYRDGTVYVDSQALFYDPTEFRSAVTINSSLSVTGTKNRLVKTNDYGNRLLYCYETASPLFGDVGEGQIGEDGKCFVWIDPKFSETIHTEHYQVFLQAYGFGDCVVTERKADHFVVEGKAGLSFGWELKAKQLGYENTRTEPKEESRDYTGRDYGDPALAHLKQIRKERGI